MAKCLDRLEVAQLATGVMPYEAQAAAAAHLSDCENCRQVLAGILEDEDLFGDIQAAYQAGAGADWPADATNSALCPALEAAPEAIEGYELLSELHRGGQGVVYKAVQKATKRTVALKILLRGAQATQQQRNRFEREIELVAALSHPNIVTIYDSGVSRERQFYAMEFVAGIPLDQFVTKHLKAKVGRARAAAELFYRIGLAVSYAHQHGVIHRDLKPANILIDAAGEPHILDFGLAKLADSTSPHAQLTASGEFLGTLAYASPEQARGDPLLIDMRTDVYSLGVILFEMLTGEYPYPVAGPLSEVLSHISQAEPRRPSRINHEIDAEIETIALKALAKQPERRYQSADHLTRDLGHYLNGEPIDAKRDSTWYLLRKSIRRYRAVVATTGAFAALMVGALALSLFLWRSAVVERDAARQAQTNEQAARLDEADARRAEQRQREEAEYQSYTANVAAAAGALRRRDVVEAGQRLMAAPQAWRGWEWQELWGRLDASRQTLEGHTSYVTNVAISRDGTLIASAGREDQSVKLWEAAAGELLASLSGSSWPVMALQPDGKRLALAFSGEGVRLWDIATRDFVMRLSGPECVLNVIAFSPDGSLLAAGAHSVRGIQGTFAILLWRLSDGKLLCEIPQETWRVNALALSPDGSLLATARFAGVELWDTASGKLKLRLPDQPGNESCVAFNHEGTLLATAGQDNTVRLWEVDSGRPVRELRGHTGPVTTVAFGPGDRFVISGSRDKTARIWSIATGEQQRVLVGHRWTVTSVDVSGDGQRLVTGAWDYEVKLWDAVDAEPRDELSGHRGQIANVAFSPNSALLATASWDHTVKLWNLNSRQAIATLSGHAAPVHGVAFSPDGSLLASCGWNGTLKLWDVASRREVATLGGHARDSRVHAVAFSPSGEWLVSGSSDDTLRIWDVRTRRTRAILSGHTDHIHAVAISADEKWIASAGHYTVKVWDAQRHVELASFPRRMVQDDYSLAFLPDHRHLTAGDMRTLTIWDVLERRPVQLLRGHTDEIHAVAVSPDGRRLASASFDNRIKLWDVAAGREVATLTDQRSHANTVAFSPDGRFLVAGLEDGSVKIWDGNARQPAERPFSISAAENPAPPELFNKALSVPAPAAK